MVNFLCGSVLTHNFYLGTKIVNVECFHTFIVYFNCNKNVFFVSIEYKIWFNTKKQVAELNKHFSKSKPALSTTCSYFLSWAASPMIHSKERLIVYYSTFQSRCGWVFPKCPCKFYHMSLQRVFPICLL